MDIYIHIIQKNVLAEGGSTARADRNELFCRPEPVKENFTVRRFYRVSVRAAPTRHLDSTRI